MTGTIEDRLRARSFEDFYRAEWARFYLGWSTEDVAEAVGTAPGSVAGRLRQALRRLETTLGEPA